MNNIKSKASNRVLAAVLSLLMFISMIPFSAITTFAATHEHPDAVTITVVDEKGNPVNDAQISMKVDSSSKGTDYILKTINTDTNGCVEVFGSSSFIADDLTLTATVNKAEYKTNTSLISAAITTDKQNFEVILQSSVIKDVDVIATSVKYDGEAHAAATVSGLKTTDIVKYKLDSGDWQTSMPTITEVKAYSLTLSVKREGYDDFIKTVSPEVSLNKIKLNVIEYAGNYDERSHPALAIAGLLDTDIVSFTLNGGTAEEVIPEVKDIGNYTVHVHVERFGYADYDETFHNIRIEATTIDGLSAKAYTGVYDNTEHDAVTLTGTKADDMIEYKLGTGSWSKELPQIKDVGNYPINVRVSRVNYTTTEVEVLPANAYISKADQTVIFTNNKYVDGAEGAITLDKKDATNNIYDFSANGGAVLDNPIIYRVENSSNDGIDIEKIATIDTDGKLTVKAAGCITITATRQGNNNYNEGVITYHLTIKILAGNLINFTETNKSYILGQDEGIVSDLTAIKANADDNGALTYSINKTNCGLAIDSLTGKITVKDYAVLGEALLNNGNSISLTIEVNKDVGKKLSWDKYVEVYSADKASYTVDIHFLETPTDTYILNGTKGKNNWYVSPVAVSAKDSNNYTVSKVCDLAGFNNSVVFDNQGTDSRHVFLRDNATGGITTHILLDGLQIDTSKPDTGKMKIEYSNSLADTILSAITLGFYKPSVTVTFTAEDITSGIDHLDWTYTRETGASTINNASQQGQLPVIMDGNKATAELILTASEAEQYRGNMKFTATDKAGNTSNVKNDEGYVIVVDTIAPTRTVEYTSPKQIIDKQMYFNGDVTAKFTINEANFFADDVIVTISKNGGKAYAVSPIWVDRSVDEHVGTLNLSGDGDYIVSMNYRDRSTNDMELYQSDTITIDTTKPVLDFSYDKDNQTTTFTVTEHNFRPTDITVLIDAKDINGTDVDGNDLANELRNSQWHKTGDTYTVTIDKYIDSIYNLTISYEDISTNKAVNKESGSFIIDHTKPTGNIIEYSTSLLDTVLSTVTFGFYNPDVTITFTAYDNTSGVNHFSWNYIKQDNQSDINRPTDKEDHQIVTVQDKVDKSKYTGTVTLPNNEFEQIRGYIAFTSTDNYANTSEKITDNGKILVVDTIAPTMKVEYSASNRTIGTNMYYNSDATATFTVNEANFFAEDVEVYVSKNGGSAYRITPSWSDNDADIHVGKIVLSALNDHSADGHYVIHVNYKDRSNNTMESYTSDTITIDTITPEASVTYANNKIISTSYDSEGNPRQYLGDKQTATLTIEEHNFNADEVDISIIARDVTGATIDDAALYSKSAWSTIGDKHIIVITYSGDANYTFDVDYTDLATNVMGNYSKDYFTVDKTAPENLTVNYSTSVLDTILESISFGFYNAKMTVTITADDQISGIQGFDYSYINTNDVSSVNSQLLSQIIDEASMKYSNLGKTVTTSFDIPKMVLKNDNQFNGTVEFTAKDRSSNSTNKKDTKRIVVDNITPTATVTYNKPVNNENGISYYDGNINAEISINEANFYANDVTVMVSKNGGAAYAQAPVWKDRSVDSHIGTFSLSGDGDYIVSITYKDKSNNKMGNYSSNQLTIDTVIDEPTITINGTNGNGKAYKNEVIPAVSFNDQNYDSNEVTLTCTRYGDKNVNVKEKFIGNRVSTSEKGATGAFDTFKKIAENDGIYTLTVKMNDKAGHKSSSSTSFTINRFGSVYSYNDELNKLINNGGAYVQSVNKDLIITEYNADRLVNDSLKIEITSDGKPVSNVKYKVSPTINEKNIIGESGWFQYQYVISKDNFVADGVYKISISSKDATGNTPENTNYKNQKILFRVDNTAPELTSVTGLEKNIVNAPKVTVEYSAYDTIGLKSITVFIDKKQIGDKITDFSADQNNYYDTFVVNERNNAQNVRIVIEDLAGNITDTNAKNFDSKYTFEKIITVSTNMLVRWYANKMLFWGSIGGVVILGVAIWYMVFLKKRKTINIVESN